MEGILKEALGCDRVRKMGGRGGGGCISEGQSYVLDEKRTVFVKKNNNEDARAMFTGEMEGLKSISLTDTVRVPQPIKVFDSGGGLYVIIMEHVEMLPLHKYNEELGTKLAQLHLHNINKIKTSIKTSGRVQSSDSAQSELVDKFGFSIPTSCGLIPMPNDWETDWIEFYARHRLQPQIDRIIKNYNNRKLVELWSNLQLKMSQYFKDTEQIFPSLLHGDLWAGNTAETANGPVMFDPAVLYGHHEFDLSISKMFSGFSSSFYEAYHKLIPISPGFDTRLKLYQLFHYLNHWNHFGSSYEQQSLSIMKQLI
ncbi:PREDICTED: ketosamine-3-kinase-like [Amphimedon queenslandica]|uniref:protein-ribulosamine 3-kinase n=1 Tax=Amphimedon queenslandica TaxID=400682 RepID=A0A1X7VIB0_AMPQE|nr:PREDICTED: ketosamine-3-kinase-like [Amphimedon queenslandica]|eukprot:XP_019848767.1 PREDICTED: ketosamine-3-kinase-like [Amphimedon queenslandica]